MEINYWVNQHNIWRMQIKGSAPTVPDQVWVAFLQILCSSGALAGIGSNVVVLNLLPIHIPPNAYASQKENKQGTQPGKDVNKGGIAQKDVVVAIQRPVEG